MIGEAAVAHGQLRVIVTYLMMDPIAPAAATPLPHPPVSGARLSHRGRPEVAFYRTLYNGVGEDWLWSDRRRLSDAALWDVLRDPRVALWVLWLDGEPAGFAELDARRSDATDLAYFGLMPRFIGRGLGPWMLDAAIAEAVATGARRMTVNTCTFDHPSALRLYQSRGFVPVRHVVRQISDPRLTGLLPETAAPHIPLAGLG